MNAIREPILKDVQEVSFGPYKVPLPEEKSSFVNEYGSLGIKGEILDYNDVKHPLESRENKLDHVLSYLKKVSKRFNRIELEESVLSGMPTIQTTRIPVNLIIACLRDGMTINDIEKDYNISNADILEALEFTIEVLTRAYMDELD